MQAAQYRFGEHERARRQSMPGFGSGQYHPYMRRTRYARPERAMRSSSVVVGDLLFENCTNMSLGDRNHLIKAFAPYRSDHPLADRVRLRTRHR